MSYDASRAMGSSVATPLSPEAMVLPFSQLLEISGVALSVVGEEDRRAIVAASDEVARRIDELQFELGEGPGFDVLRSGLPQQTLLRYSRDERRPFFESAVQELGVSTIITLPLRLGAITVGVVTLYRQDLGPLNPSEMATAAALVHWVAGPAIERAILSAGQDVLASGESEGELRREVHQATGMIIVQADCTASDAFLQLRAHAFAEGRTVQSVARDVINRRLNFADLEYR